MASAAFIVLTVLNGAVCLRAFRGAFTAAGMTLLMGALLLVAMLGQ